jgi:hypothetical protein
MYSVLMENRYPQDFVTSKFSEISFDSLDECKEYVKRSRGFHPGRFSYSFRKKVNDVWVNLNEPSDN